MANQTVVSAAAIWQGLFDTLTGDSPTMDFIKSGEVYFVDGNAGLNTNSGKDWNNAFNTLTYALAASHANIAGSSKGWAARNRIYCKGDTLTENLTKLAQKTDIIGVGSFNNKSMPGLLGTHAIAAVTWLGCRFFNFEFLNDSADATWTFSQGGFEFHNCVFRCDASATTGITMAVPSDVKIFNCQFLPDVDNNQFDTAAIVITGGAYNCQIKNNLITGDLGITIDSGNYYHCRIDNNIFQTVGMTINDASDDWYVTNNQMIANVNQAVITNIVTSNANLAVKNLCTGTGGATKSYPTIT